MDLIGRYKVEYCDVMHGAASPEEVDRLLAKYGVKEPLYRQWLVETGAGPIGSNWYDGLAELEASQEKLAMEGWGIRGFVIGWDGSGNPIVIREDGVVLTEDHDLGGIHVVASDFRSLLASGVGA